MLNLKVQTSNFGEAMQELIGKHFCIEGVEYAVVDVRSVGSTVMVYAQPQKAAGEKRLTAAFRLDDIQPQLLAHLETG